MKVIGNMRVLSPNKGYHYKIRQINTLSAITVVLFVLLIASLIMSEVLGMNVFINFHEPYFLEISDHGYYDQILGHVDRGSFIKKIMDESSEEGS